MARGTIILYKGSGEVEQNDKKVYKNEKRQ